MTGQDSGQIHDLRLRNRRSIFAALRRLGHAARIELADETGLSRATITSITADMVAEGLLEELPEPETPRSSRRGRPRIALRIRPDRFLIGGANIGDQRIIVTLLDFEGGEVLHSVTSRPQEPGTTKEVAEQLRQAVAEALLRVGRGPEALDGLGVGIAGFVDSEAGIVHWSPVLSERSVAFAAHLNDVFDCPVFLDNDANLAALAEQRFGYGKDVRDFLVVTIEHGIGLGIVIGNEIYRGARGMGAEFGHTKVIAGGALCRCGQRGCVEAYVGDYALLLASKDAIGLRSADPIVQLDALFAEAKTGHPAAKAIVSRAGRMFAAALGNLITVFDPSLIIFSGEQLRYDMLYSSRVLEKMQALAIVPGRLPPEIRIHRWGDRLWALGAATLAANGLSSQTVSLLDKKELKMHANSVHAVTH